MHINRRRFISKATLALTGINLLPRHLIGAKMLNGSKPLAPSDMINLGIIGAGKQGRGLVNNFINTGQVKVLAISEVYKAKADLMLTKINEIYQKNEKLGTVNNIDIFTDYRDLLSRKDIDAVVIATPDHWHAAMAVNAANAGKDIYGEKPLSLTVKEGRAMVNATRKNQRIFQTGSMQRSWPEFRHAAELIRNGHIGNIKHIKVNVGLPPKPYDLTGEPIPDGLDWIKWLGPNEFSEFNSKLAPPTTKDVFPDWRLFKEFGGGMVTDWGAHMFDIVQWALDMDHSGPVKVSAPNGNEFKFLTYQYANGITMTHEKWEWNNAIHFIGDKGEIKVQRRKLETSPDSLATLKIQEAAIHVYNSDNHYLDFLNAMRSRKMPICDVEIGHRTASVCNIGNIAYQLGRSLEWDPAKEKFQKDSEANCLLGRKMNKAWGIKI